MNFIDPETCKRLIFSDKSDPEELKTYIDPSQLEITYGGICPNVTQFWPPTMPPMPASSPPELI